LDDLEDQYRTRNCIGCSASSLETARLSCNVHIPAGCCCCFYYWKKTTFYIRSPLYTRYHFRGIIWRMESYDRSRKMTRNEIAKFVSHVSANRLLTVPTGLNCNANYCLAK